MDAEINWIGVFHHQQEHEQITKDPWLFLSISGLERCFWKSPSGRVIHEQSSAAPYLLLVPQGTTFNFSYGERRENWVCGLQGLDLRQGEQGLELQEKGGWIAFPQLARLSLEAAKLWAVELRQIQHCIHNPLPGNRLRAKLGLAAILRFLYDSAPAQEIATPARRLRTLIEADQTCQHSLEELSTRCGYSSDHLRLCFEREFGITPQKYRNQWRMARAMELVINSTLSAKEMARQLGFPYLTHFSTAFRATHGFTPSEAIHRRRQVSASGE